MFYYGSFLILELNLQFYWNGLGEHYISLQEKYLFGDKSLNTKFKHTYIIEKR